MKNLLLTLTLSILASSVQANAASPDSVKLKDLPIPMGRNIEWDNGRYVPFEPTRNSPELKLNRTLKATETKDVSSDPRAGSIVDAFFQQTNGCAMKVVSVNAPTLNTLSKGTVLKLNAIHINEDQYTEIGIGGGDKTHLTSGTKATMFSFDLSRADNASGRVYSIDCIVRDDVITLENTLVDLNERLGNIFDLSDINK